MYAQRVLVTGAAGFIGFHVVMKLIELGINVVGVDNINDYYSPTLKLDRLKEIDKFAKVQDENFDFRKYDITNLNEMSFLFEEFEFDYVINLAAQAGVRYSIESPRSYLSSNIDGFMNILELCVSNKVKHLVYASSSSIYGNSRDIPFSTHQHSSKPESMYAATKKMNELMAHVFSTQYKLKTTGLRFFTVYGPWGRPDMAPFKFAKNIMEGKPIDLYNYGDHMRDFTYIDDIVSGVIACFAPDIDEGDAKGDCRVYNIGYQRGVKLLDFIDLLEVSLGKKAEKILLPMQLGDVHTTYANSNPLTLDKGWVPKIPLAEGIPKFSKWFIDYKGEGH